MAKKFTLNDKQQRMVEENLSLVEIILRKNIHPNENIRGMEYDELYQCGCLALCKAAAEYNGTVKFATFAGTVIRNAMIDQCRYAMAYYNKTLSIDETLTDDEDTFAGMAMSEESGPEDPLFCDELMALVQAAKKKHTGAVLKGIEAIELRVKGYTGAEIAKMYGVKNNNVTSWISKAVAVMRKEYPEYCL